MRHRVYHILLCNGCARLRGGRLRPMILCMFSQLDSFSVLVDIYHTCTAVACGIKDDFITDDDIMYAGCTGGAAGSRRDVSLRSVVQSSNTTHYYDNSNTLVDRCDSEPTAHRTNSSIHTLSPRACVGTPLGREFGGYRQQADEADKIVVAVEHLIHSHSRHRRRWLGHTYQLPTASVTLLTSPPHTTYHTPSPLRTVAQPAFHLFISPYGLPPTGVTHHHSSLSVL